MRPDEMWRVWLVFLDYRDSDGGLVLLSVYSNRPAAESYAEEVKKTNPFTGRSWIGGPPALVINDWPINHVHIPVSVERKVMG